MLRLSLLLLFLLSGWSQAASPDSDYLAARAAQQAGDEAGYQALRRHLGQHPLVSYLDYYQLKAHLDELDDKAVRGFLRRYPDSPLGAFLVSRFIDKAGRQQQWQALLSVQSIPPRGARQRCYFYRAKLAAGQLAIAWQGAKALYLVGQSQDKACDPLFTAWRRAGGLTSKVVLARMEKAFAAGNGALLGYLGRSLHGRARQQANTLLALYQQPEQVAHSMPQLASAAMQRQLVMLAVQKLARQQPLKAYRVWMQARKNMAFDYQQRRHMARFLVPRLYSVSDNDATAWRDRAVGFYRDDQLTARRIRFALAQGDFEDARHWLEQLHQQTRNEPQWQYWLARTDPNPAARQQRYAKLAQHRSYYGFLAAEKLGEPFVLNAAPPPPMTSGLRAIPALKRVQALQTIDEPRLAQIEWHHLLQQLSDHQRQALAGWANEQGFAYLAVSAAIRGEGWDLIKLRFPLAFEKWFDRYAKRQQLAKSFAMALSRQESALNPKALSAVGARGLMQLMPATARHTAKALGETLALDALYQPQTNIRLGTAYLRQMLTRFNGNRILAAAAYNAGPNRVERWVGNDLPFDAFVEAIPFKETRRYVKNVLAFNVIYQRRLGHDDIAMLSHHERLYRY
ncbi:transglycosylase SLT domain-containing protein [Gallaecimonas sp. GXIMD1310]|uniref:transglycosylase SLT domain-containing protein n=1 Tax=Gallaecimonas sp. GXIMD1310 TaxID=3131926 RepID=UPI003250C1B5